MTTIPRALLFDLDGVLSDTQKLHAEVSAVVLERHGIRIQPAEISRRFSGVKNEEWFPTLAAEQHTTLDTAQAIEDKWAEFIRQLPARADAIPGGRELLLAGNQAGWLIGVVSASRHAVVANVLKLLGVEPFVGVIIGADDVSRGKPHPEGYLAAAQRLGAPANRCVVIEDGLAGIIAAHTAGMATVGLGPHARQDDHYPPSLATDSLTTVTISQLEQLIASS